MTKAERFEDIKNRYSLTLAERNILEPETENYNILSELAKKILSEYSAVSKARSSGKVKRNGFRLCGGHYKIIVLSTLERV